MNLWNLDEQSRAIISDFTEVIPENYRRRLRELGFHPNEPVTCVHHTFGGGPRLYQVGNCVYSLEKQIAENIMIYE